MHTKYDFSHFKMVCKKIEQQLNKTFEFINIKKKKKVINVLIKKKKNVFKKNREILRTDSYCNLIHKYNYKFQN